MMFIDLVQEKVKNIPDNLTLAMDCWTDNHKQRSYVNYRLYYCKDFDLFAIYVKNRDFCTSAHSTDRISTNIKETIDEFNLNSKCITAVSDNGANIVPGLKRAKITRMACTAHCFHFMLTVDIYNDPQFSLLKIV